MDISLNSALAYLKTQAAAFGGRAAILGKGPSFADFDQDVQNRGRFVVGLNETCMCAPCHAAFIIDEDILHYRSPDIAATSIQALITPRVPHRKTLGIGGLAIYGPAGRTATEYSWAATLNGRLHGFNLSTAAPAPELGETIQAFNFSAPTAAYLLSTAGFTDILLAGIDGGTEYSGDFKSLEYKKLKSVQSDFNAQFAELRLIREHFGTKFRSARCSDNWILIGTDAEQWLATEVLKWSIESRTFLTVAYCDPNAASRDLYQAGTAGTPFSFQRIFLPEQAGRRGRGLYFDSDMLIFRDVYELFNWDMGEHVLLGCKQTPGRRAQYSVFLVDNERASWSAEAVLADYQSGRVSYDALMKDFCFAEPKASTLPLEWNSLEFFEPGRTANIHFTDMGTQPWLSVYNPNAQLWCEALFEAARARPEVVKAFETSADRGWIRPSLKWQFDNERSDPWSLPRQVKALDRDWLPPHVRLRQTTEPQAMQMLKWKLASRVRRVIQSRPYVRLMRAGHALRKVF